MTLASLTECNSDTPSARSPLGLRFLICKMEEELQGVKFFLEPPSDSKTLSGLLKDSGDRPRRARTFSSPSESAVAVPSTGRGGQARSTPVLCELGHHAPLPARSSLGTNELTSG